MRAAIAVRRGIADHIQLEWVIPILNYDGGNLDGFIEGFHDSFSLSQAGRLGVSKDTFRAYVQGASGTLVIDKDPGTRLGDMTFGAKFQLREPNGKRRYHLAIERARRDPNRRR